MRDRTAQDAEGTAFFAPGAYLPAVLRYRVIEDALGAFFRTRWAARAYAAHRHLALDDFLRAALALKGISPLAVAKQAAGVPARGPLVVVANHPRGLIDGLIMLFLLNTARDDVRLLANRRLEDLAPLGRQVLAVGPSPADNRRLIRDALGHLAAGGCLLVFPAGTVAHFDWRRGAVAEAPWHPLAFWLARRAAAPILPVRLYGRNSRAFDVLAAVSRIARTVCLLREFAGTGPADGRLDVGEALPPAAADGPARAFSTGEDQS